MSAAVAVFDSTVEIAADAVPKAAMRPAAVRAKSGRPSSHAARRTSSPKRLSASASRNEPRNRKITGSAKGASTWRAGATPVTIASAAATSEVAGSGIASVIHQVIASASTARSRRASGGWEPGFQR